MARRRPSVLQAPAVVEGTHKTPRWLTGLRATELTALLGSRARAMEALRWLYAVPPRPAPPHVHAERWERLLAEHPLPAVDVVERALAPDGTTKLLFAFERARVEAVLIPFEDRTTLCLSSQAGCTRHCRFCATATLGFGRNLTAGEIVAQYLFAAREATPHAPVRNVVFMGMGEPMDNLPEVLRAVEVLTQSPAPQLKAERVTVSTSGILPGMLRFLRESKASLALSLNATTDAQRDVLMPQNKQWPIAALLDALREDNRAHPKRVHFMEYVMLDGVNDSDDDARRLGPLLEGINARVNLIPHNVFEGNDYRPSPLERVHAFQRIVASQGLRCLIRLPRGAEVSAACGQLARRSSSA